jgi:isoquinoline 1-oxidoreductase alpha subunit
MAVSQLQDADRGIIRLDCTSGAGLPFQYRHGQFSLPVGSSEPNARRSRPQGALIRMLLMAFAIKVNGTIHNVDVDGDTPLLWVLRDVLTMTGTKFGCGKALCGACTVHLDGTATRSCITSIDSIGDSKITTIETIGATATGAAIQRAWLDRQVVQCGYCQSGQIMSAAALLASNHKPSDGDIADAMSGNICRCGTYLRIREAIRQAAQSRKQEG